MAGLNLVICNCTYDVIIFTLWQLLRFNTCMVYVSSSNVWIENGDFRGRKLYSRLPCCSTTGKELNCVRERRNTEDCYAVAVIRRSAVVGHMSAERCQSLMHCSWDERGPSAALLLEVGISRLTFLREALRYSDWEEPKDVGKWGS